MWQLNGANENSEVKEKPLATDAFSNVRESTAVASARKGANAKADDKVIWHAPKEAVKREPFSVLKMQLLLCGVVLLAVVAVKFLLKDGFVSYAEQLDIWLSQGIDFAQRDEAARFVNGIVNGVYQGAQGFLQLMQS